MKVKMQKKTNLKLDKEISEIQQTIKDKLTQNESMSKRAKELKGMFIQKTNDSTIVTSKGPPSPKLSEGIKEQL